LNARSILSELWSGIPLALASLAVVKSGITYNCQVLISSGACLRVTTYTTKGFGGQGDLLRDSSRYML
jgi:hypothetical protein